MKSYQEFITRKQREHGEKFDPSDLNPAFIPFYESGKRITVEFFYDETRRGTIGVTTGWKPCFLLMLRRDSRGSSHTIGKNDKVLRPY